MPTHPIPISDHYDGRLFFNPGGDSDRSFADVARWRRTSRPAPWPEHRANIAYPPPPAAVGAGEIALTFVGHATVLVTMETCRFLCDPFFSERAGPFARLGPKRVRAPGLALADLPPLDMVLLSHNHYDHMDLPALRAIRRRPSRAGLPVPVVTGLGNAGTLARGGVRGATELDWWESVSPVPGVTVTYTPAQHWSRRGLRDRRRALWGGFVVETGGARFYFAGDSGYCPWFRTIGDRLGAPDLAVLPIGAYAPRWFMQPQHMNPAEAVQAHLDLRAARSVGVHFGTVQLTDEAIDEPPEALASARAAAGVAPGDFATLDVGETLTVSVRAVARAAPTGSRDALGS